MPFIRGQSAFHFTFCVLCDTGRSTESTESVNAKWINSVDSVVTQSDCVGVS